MPSGKATGHEARDAIKQIRQAHLPRLGGQRDRLIAAKGAAAFARLMSSPRIRRLRGEGHTPEPPPVPRRNRAIVRPQTQALMHGAGLKGHQGRSLGGIAPIDPCHAGLDLGCIGVLTFTSNMCDGSAVAVQPCLRHHLGLLLETQGCQMLLAALPEGLRLLRGIDVGKAHLDVPHLRVLEPSRGLLRAADGQGVSVTDSDDGAKQ